MKTRIAFAAMAICTSTWAMAQEPVLPVPSGYAEVAGTQARYFVKTDSLRQNISGGEPTTFALVMSFIEDGKGNKGYAVSQMTAWCETGKLSRSSIRYFNAQQQPVAKDDKPVAAKVGEGTVDAFVHSLLCSEWGDDG